MFNTFIKCVLIYESETNIFMFKNCVCFSFQQF